jgi:phosphotransferase system IIB component
MSFEANLPFLITILSISIVILLLLIIFIILKNKKNVVVDDDFMEMLINSLGGKDNIISYDKENQRVRFELKDIQTIDKDNLKLMSPRGVFITGSMIKLLFKYEAEDVILMLNKKTK